MADPIPVVNIVERLLSTDTYKKYAVYVLITVITFLLFCGGFALWRFFFGKPNKQINKPVAVAIGRVEKGAIDQTSTQIQLNEKDWEIGVGAGGLQYDNKNGVCLFGFVKKKL